MGQIRLFALLLLFLFWACDNELISPEISDVESVQLSDVNCGEEYTKIYYKSADNKIIEPYNSDAFDAELISNSYDNGLGVMLFRGKLTEIGYRAFRDCSKLVEITIPEGIRVICERAFEYCRGLKRIHLSNEVAEIEQYAFMFCESLLRIELSDNLLRIGSDAFWHCVSLDSVNIPRNVTYIGNSIFSNCDNLSAITVDTLNAVYDSRNNCNAIIHTSTNKLISGCKNTIIPNRIQSIGDCAFVYCNNLTTIDIPEGVTHVGEYAFYGCSNLSEVKIHENITSIGNAAFGACRNLYEIIVMSIEPPVLGEYGFHLDYVSDFFAEIQVPIGAEEWYQNADGWNRYADLIIGVDWNEKIVFEDSEVKRLCVKNWDTNGDGELSCVEASAVTTLSNVFSENTMIKSFTELSYFTGLTSINDHAFSDCRALQRVELPNTIASIDESAFHNCYELAMIHLPESLKSIGVLAFDRCSKLQNINLPAGLLSIGYCAFFGAAFTQVSIPRNVEYVGDGAFAQCSKIESIDVDADNCYYDSRANSNAIIETATNALVAGCNNTTIPEGVESIRRFAFYGCSNMTEITIPSTVTAIGDYAFYRCKKLSSVTFLSTKRPTLGELVFGDCPIISFK